MRDGLVTRTVYAVVHQSRVYAERDLAETLGGVLRSVGWDGGLPGEYQTR